MPKADLHAVASKVKGELQRMIDRKQDGKIVIEIEHLPNKQKLSIWTGVRDEIQMT